MSEPAAAIEGKSPRLYNLPPPPRSLVLLASRGMLLFIAALSATGLVSIVFNVLSGRGPLSHMLGYAIAFVAMFVFGTCIGVFTFVGSGRGAISCEWSENRFVLHYRHLSEKVFDWTSPKFRCQMSRYNDSEKTEYELNTRFPFFTPIPEDLYDAILSEAYRRGLTVTSKRTVVGSYTYDVQTIRPQSPTRR